MQQQYLLAAAVLATLLVSVTSAGFEFYKFCLVWPTSFCNVRADCKASYPNGHFVIHGLWPQFADDTPVPPYSKNKTCTSVIPTPEDQIMNHLQPIQARLEAKWPTLVNKYSNSGLWKREWLRHGMCSDYPREPKGYFEAGLSLAAQEKYDPLKVMGIKPGAQTTTETVLTNAYKKLKAYPQLSCNMNGQVRQLEEVCFCFDRAKPPVQIRSCPARFHGQCKTWKDTIMLPSTAQSSSYIIGGIVSPSSAV